MARQSIEPGELADQVLRGDRRAAARLISWIEDGRSEAGPALRRLYPHTGRAHLVGLTGPPGAGKSTLIAALVRELRRQGRRVGVIAVDPTSPYTGGALLGDRVRMQDVSLDSGVFIRSMATRGAVGAMARDALDAARVLEAFGCAVVLLETVGAGQADVAVAEVAQTVVVVEVPQLGDEVQAIKAGILEAADVLVVNKADQPGANHAAASLRLALGRGGAETAWHPPIVKTVATTGEGVAELAAAVDRHLDHLRSDGQLEQRAAARARQELSDALASALLARLVAGVGEAEVGRLAAAVARREIDPSAAAAALLDRAAGGRGTTA